MQWMWAYNHDATDSKGKPMTTVRLSAAPREDGRRVRVRVYRPKGCDLSDWR